MRRYWLFILIAIAFIAVSVLLYYTHYLIFHDPHHIFIFMVGDLAFLPFEVFLVVIVIERILTRREKQAIMQKLNMVIGAFFSEVGSRLLRDIIRGFEKSLDIGQKLAVDQNWSHADFKNAMVYASGLSETPNLSAEELEELGDPHGPGQGEPQIVEPEPLQKRLSESGSGSREKHTEEAGEAQEKAEKLQQILEEPDSQDR